METNNNTKPTLSQFTDLIHEELTLIYKATHWGRKNYILEDIYKEQICNYSDKAIIEVYNTLKDYADIQPEYYNSYIFWILAMSNIKCRDILNNDIGFKNFFNSTPYSDMTDMYLFILHGYFIKNEDIPNIELLLNDSIKDIREANQRKSFKTFLDNQMEVL